VRTPSQNEEAVQTAVSTGSDEVADQAGRSIRRLANRSIYDQAVELRVADDARVEFLCECGHLECHDVVVFPLSEFDTFSAPGTIVAHG
jgi:hypothetical protein